MKEEGAFIKLLQENLDTASIIEREALALSLGFYPKIEDKMRMKYLESFIKNNDLILRRAALISLGFSSLLKNSSAIKKQQALIKKCLNDPLITIRVTAAIALGINALFSKNTKLIKNTYNEFRKNVLKKNINPIVKQGYSFSLGLLSKSHYTKKDCFESILNSYSSKEMETPAIYLMGFTLAAINTGKAEEGFDFISNYIIPSLLNKESRRIAIICTAFLFPLIKESVRLEKLENLINRGVEHHSKFGTDSAIVLTFFSYLNDHNKQEDFLGHLLGLKELDPDYNIIYNILKENKTINEILEALIKCNLLDVKAAGINASFFLESKEAGEIRINLESFIDEGVSQRGSGYFDRFLVLLRTFSFCLMKKEYSRVEVFEQFLHSNDLQIKRFAGLAYACLKAKDPEHNLMEDLYLKLIEEQDLNIRWGLWLGIAISECIGLENYLDDELILGILLLCLGLTDASTSLLISQAMVSKFYQ